MTDKTYERFGMQKRRTKRTPSQQADHDDKILDDFNSANPVGKLVWYWKSLPFGPVVETIIRAPAWRLPSGVPVCMVDGVTGGVSIYHIDDVDESRRAEVNPTRMESDVTDLNNLPELTDEERAAMNAIDMTPILGTLEERLEVARSAAVRWLTKYCNLKAERQQTCRWKYDDTHDKYDASCGQAYILIGETPAKNDYVFCPGCGKRIET